VTKEFLAFIIEPAKESFLASRKIVIEHTDYDPYSDDINELEELLQKGKMQEAVACNNINTLLSPRAHLIKNKALTALGQEKDAKSELIFAVRIMECIALTGDGSMEQPRVVTRVEDERDFLAYMQEQFAAQQLMSSAGKKIDRLTTQSGKELHFDITDCYSRMQELFDTRKTGIEDILGTTSRPAKPWWKFW
jgi:hypothetical protein